MTTIQQTVDRAAYELGYIEYGAALDATDAADAMNALNDMMAEWKYRSMDFNWFTQDTLGDTLPIPRWAQSGVISNLAVRLSAVFNVQPPAQTLGKADVGERTIANTLILQGLDNADMSHLPQGQGRTGRYDINRDA